MRIRYHCEVCDEAYETPEAAKACEAKPSTPHPIGAKMECFGIVVEIVERSGIGRGNHDYLYRAKMRWEDGDNERLPGACLWSPRDWYHHNQFKFRLAAAA